MENYHYTIALGFTSTVLRKRNKRIFGEHTHTNTPAHVRIHLLYVYTALVLHLHPIIVDSAQVIFTKKRIVSRF